MKAIRMHIPRRVTTIFLAVVMVCTTVPFSAFATLAVDLKANGQDSLTLATSTASFDITLTQTEAVSCSISGPSLSSGFAIGSTMTIAPGNPSYPAVGGSSTFNITCLDAGGATQSDSVVVSLPAAALSAPTIDLKANGSDGPVTITSGSPYTYTWTSANATACQMSSPVSSGVTLSGSGTVNPGDPFYPTLSSPTTISITCTNGTVNASDSVVINLAGSSGGAPTVDVKANGLDGTVTITSGSPYTYTWTSANATACQMSSPVSSGVTLSGSGTVNPGDPFYPASSSTPVTITITCTNGSQNATDSVVVQLGIGPLALPTVDVKANGSDGPVTIVNGSTYTATWTSANATACQMTPPVVSGVTLSGTTSAIGPGSPFYPSTTTPVTITVTCTNGTANASDSVVIQLAGGVTVPTVDIKANGSDGPVTINNGDTYTLSWVSANATACQMTPPVVSGVTLSGTSSPIGPGSPFYPSGGAGSSVTVTITCTNGTANAVDSVVIVINNPGSPGSGGGGSSVSTAVLFPGTVHHAITATCPWIHDYMRIDFQNDPVEVAKLQAFLKTFMGYDYVTINGVFDQATWTAVGAFQMAYQNDILTPWGHTAPTHYVYILTLKKVNELLCQQELPLTADQLHEIAAFRSLINNARSSGTGVYYRNSSGRSGGTGFINTKEGLVPADGTSGGGSYASSTTTVVPQTSTSTVPIEVPVVGSQGQITTGLAAALFTFPDNLKDTMQCLFEFVLILIVLYILGSVLKDVLYSDLPENALKRFLAKWITISLGLLAALVVAYFLSEFCLLLPLLVALVASLLWTAFYPKHDIAKTTTRQWTTVENKEEKKVA